jgi:hypothetical protein
MSEEIERCGRLSKGVSALEGGERRKAERKGDGRARSDLWRSLSAS